MSELTDNDAKTIKLIVKDGKRGKIMDDENLQKTFEAMMFTLSTYQKGFDTIYEENIGKEDMTMTDIINLTDVWWRGVTDIIARLGGGK